MVSPSLVISIFCVSRTSLACWSSGSVRWRACPATDRSCSAWPQIQQCHGVNLVDLRWNRQHLMCSQLPSRGSNESILEMRSGSPTSRPKLIWSYAETCEKERLGRWSSLPELVMEDRLHLFTVLSAALRLLLPGKSELTEGCSWKSLGNPLEVSMEIQPDDHAEGAWSTLGIASLAEP